MRWKGKLLLSIFIFTSILCNRQQEKEEKKNQNMGNSYIWISG
jgi:preprotein translocase subunit YajC